MHIAHHLFDRQKLSDYYSMQQEGIETSKTIFNKGKYFVLRDMYNETLAVSCCSVILNKDITEIKKNFSLFLEVAIGKYMMGTNIGSEISFMFLNNPYKYIPEPKNYTLTDQGWITAFFSALLFLDLDKIAELNKVDMEKVMEVTNVKGGEYTYLFAKFLQHVFKGDENNFENLKKVSNAIKPGRLDGEIFTYANDIIGGQVDLFGAALLKEEPYFNDVLLKTLQWHKEYYTNDPQNPEGLFSVPLTAIMVLAKYYNIKVQHTSDYAPAFFMNI